MTPDGRREVTERNHNRDKDVTERDPTTSPRETATVILGWLNSGPQPKP
jgi:hypothetical protein